MNPMVSKCPNCRILIYKTDGCHHMTCRRCNKEWCWICRRILGDNYSKHYKPGALFGCQGLMQMPESKILFVIVLTLQLLCSPFVVMHSVSYNLGKIINETCGLRIRKERAKISVSFWFGIILVPIIMIPTVIILPVVLIYRALILIKLILRSLCFCWCC